VTAITASFHDHCFPIPGTVVPGGVFSSLCGLLSARDPVIAEQQHGSEKAYFEKVVSSHSKAPASTISEPLFITAVWPSWGGKPARSTPIE
jgi:hypothetical protein